MVIVNYCDICGEITKRPIRVGVVGSNQYCEKCWKNRKKWALIHGVIKSKKTKK